MDLYLNETFIMAHQDCISEGANNAGRFLHMQTNKIFIFGCSSNGSLESLALLG